MKQLGILALVLVLLAAACQPATTTTPTTLPTVVVTELPTGGDDTTGAEATEDVGTTGLEATEAAGVTGAEATGEPAVATEVSAVTGAATAEATADLAAMMPGDYCIEITGLEDGDVVMRMNDGTYTYEFEGTAGAESTTGAAPNVVATGMHTLRFTDAGGTVEFILTFSDDIALGAYPIGTARLADMAAGANVPEATAEGTAEFNASTGQNAPNTNTGAGGAGSSASAGANPAEATAEAGTSGSAGTSGTDMTGTGGQIVITGACADAMREAGMEATAEADDMTAEATESAEGGAAVAGAATESPLETGTSGDAAAETVPAPAAFATATDASATVVASGSDTEPGAEATADVGAGQPLQTTPASPAEPTEITSTTVIGARLEPAGGAGTSYTVLEDGTLEFTRMEQQENVTIFSGRFMLMLTSAEDTISRVTVSGFFLNLPVNQTAQ